MKTEYLQYDIFDLAAEEYFIAWIKNGEHNQSWQDWLTQHPEKKELVEGARSLIEEINFKTISLPKEEKSALWDKIDSSTPQVSVKPGRRIFLYASIAAVAASLLLVYNIVVSGNGNINVEAVHGEHMMVNLPDESLIKLNADSKVQYSKDKFLEERTIALEGEAFFEVEKGSTFTVKMYHASVEVLGTSFNIFSRNDSVKVDCYTGKVKVSNGKEEVILLPGESVRFVDDGPISSKTYFQVEDTSPNWTRGFYAFDNAPLSDVFEEFERQYNVKVTFQDEAIKALEYDGSFEGGSIEDALKEILIPMSLTHEKNGSTYLIKK